MIKITQKQLEKLGACKEGIEWFKEKKLKRLKAIVGALLKDNKTAWARWLLPRLMTHKQQVQWAIFAAEQVLSMFEKRYPNDPSPRNAIKAAKGWLKGEVRTEKIRQVAYAAANAAANAAYAAANAAANAAYADNATNLKMSTKILNYGLKLLGEK